MNILIISEISTMRSKHLHCKKYTNIVIIFNKCDNLVVLLFCGFVLSFFIRFGLYLFK